jgi:hypothetical protein
VSLAGKKLGLEYSDFAMVVVMYNRNTEWGELVRDYIPNTFIVGDFENHKTVSLGSEYQGKFTGKFTGTISDSSYNSHTPPNLSLVEGDLTMTLKASNKSDFLFKFNGSPAVTEIQMNDWSYDVNRACDKSYCGGDGTTRYKYKGGYLDCSYSYSCTTSMPLYMFGKDKDNSDPSEVVGTMSLNDPATNIRVDVAFGATKVVAE